MLPSHGSGILILITKDIFLRFIKPDAKDKVIKHFARSVQAIVLILAFFIIPVAAKEETVTRLIQDLISIPLGVMIAVYLVGDFSTKATPWAAFIGALAGTFVAAIIYFILPGYVCLPRLKGWQIGDNVNMAIHLG